MFADHKKTLTIFHDILKATLGELDDQSVDTITMNCSFMKIP